MISFGLGVKITVVPDYYMGKEEEAKIPRHGSFFIHQQRRNLYALQTAIINKNKKMVIYTLLLTLASEL